VAERAQPSEDAWPIVALVASSGGVDALSRVLAPLPAELPVAVVALLHLPPEHESALPEILQRGTALDVRAARDGDRLEPGVVLVAPPGCHTLVTPELEVVLIQSGPFPPSRPSADLLLTTLAVAAGRRLIAVVLSGEGRDGATGATAVHRFGGTVLATDATSSRHFAMPSETIRRDSAVDHVVDLDALPALLTQLALAPAIELPTLPPSG
jgi:two-component system chemotaxis response regulator CheB